MALPPFHYMRSGLGVNQFCIVETDATQSGIFPVDSEPIEWIVEDRKKPDQVFCTGVFRFQQGP